MQQNQPFPILKIAAENAVEVVFGAAIEPATHRQVLAFQKNLTAAALPGLRAVTPAFASVLVQFDVVEIFQKMGRSGSPAQFVLDFLEKNLKKWSLAEPTAGRLHEIPVRYDGEDLPALAEQKCLKINELVDLHCSVEYQVYMIGFLPGFPYLGILPEELQVPRRATPRVRVPAGSVAIAGLQTGIYPQPSPGGWHLIGRTDFELFDLRKNPPASLQAGDRVRFLPIR